MCGRGLHDARQYVGGHGVHSGSLLIVLLSLVHFLFMLFTCFQAHIGLSGSKHGKLDSCCCILAACHLVNDRPSGVPKC